MSHKEDLKSDICWQQRWLSFCFPGSNSMCVLSAYTFFPNARCASCTYSIVIQRYYLLTLRSLSLFAQWMCVKGSAAGCCISVVLVILSLLWFSTGQGVRRIPLMMTLSACVCAHALSGFAHQWWQVWIWCFCEGCVCLRAQKRAWLVGISMFVEALSLSLSYSQTPQFTKTHTCTHLLTLYHPMPAKSRY